MTSKSFGYHPFRKEYGLTEGPSWSKLAETISLSPDVMKQVIVRGLNWQTLAQLMKVLRTQGHGVSDTLLPWWLLLKANIDTCQQLHACSGSLSDVRKQAITFTSHRILIRLYEKLHVVFLVLA